MRLFWSRGVIGIAVDALDSALEASTEMYPNKHVGLLRGKETRRVNVDRDGYVMTDVLIIPGTILGPYGAAVRSNLVPNDSHVVGPVHSHPSGVLRSSDADLDTFGSGRVHIVIGSSYGPDDWEAFDQSDEVRDFDVLDADLSDPESFLDFTQGNIDAELDR